MSVDGLVEFYSGDDHTVDFTLTQPGVTTPQDISGYSFTFYVKSTPEVDDSLSDLIIPGVIEDAGNGLVRFSISAALSVQVRGTYTYVIRYIALDGTRHTAKTGTLAARSS